MVFYFESHTTTWPVHVGEFNKIRNNLQLSIHRDLARRRLRSRRPSMRTAKKLRASFFNPINPWEMKTHLLTSSPQNMNIHQQNTKRIWKVYWLTLQVEQIIQRSWLPGGGRVHLSARCQSLNFLFLSILCHTRIKYK